MILVVAATGLLVFPLIEGRDLGWPIWAYGMIATSILLVSILAGAQRRAARAGRSPLITPELFRHRSFGLGLVVSLLLFATTAAFALTFSLLLQLGHGFSAIHTVLTALFITAGIMVSAGGMSKKVIPALGRWSLTIGALVAAGGTATTGLIADQAGGAFSSWQLAPGLFVLGAGMGMMVVPLLPFILSSVDPDHAGSASGIAGAVQQLGGAIGIAVIGAIVFPQLKEGAGYGHAFMSGIWRSSRCWASPRCSPCSYRLESRPTATNPTCSRPVTRFSALVLRQCGGRAPRPRDGRRGRSISSATRETDARAVSGTAAARGRRQVPR
jgi:Major Facilitator Superfamily